MRSQYLFLILLASLLSSSSQAQSTKNGDIQKMQDQPSYVEHSITSKDGTKIGYLEIGEGPGLILVEGAMGTAYNYDQLARKLATDFTVYLPDRRGRGLSPKEFRPDHTIQRDIEDLSALLDKTGAHYVYGLSSGAVITIEATRTLPAIKKAAIYEPPFHPSTEPMDLKQVDLFNRQVTQGNLAAAMVTALKMVRLGPAILNLVPRPLLEFGAARAIHWQDQKGTAPYAPFRQLIPAMRYDFRDVSEMQGKQQTYRSVRQDVLLLGGTASPNYLKEALNTLEKTLPKVRRIEFEGLDHAGSWNKDKGGHPDVVAEALRNFFKN